MLKKNFAVLGAAVLFITLNSCQSKSKVENNSVQAAELKAAPETGLEIGNIAPNIELPDVNGQMISLSSLRGQMVLIDFWASWCPPCRAENPNLVRAYTLFMDKEFKNGKGFTVFSVSLDRSKEAWLEGIQQDKLSWPYHVSDLKYWQSAVLSLYNIQGIPANFLINGEGVIINSGLRGTMLEHVLEAQLK